MILGIGTDLVQKDRVKAIYKKYELGKPSITSSKLETIKNHLSITNTDSYTLSFVVIEK